jgi:hypothetical protein
MYKSALRFLTRRGSDVDDRRDPRERVGGPPNAEPLLMVPFDLQSCTLADQPTDAEQAAFDAHTRACQSWEEFWERAPSADWMLDALRGQWEWIPVVPERHLRTFALRCIEGLHGADHAGLQDLVQAVRCRVDGKGTLQELSGLQERKRALVTPSGVQGVPRCSPHAAGALAAWHTADRSPYDAAFWTAEFGARHDAFIALEGAAASWTWSSDSSGTWRESWRTTLFATAHPAIYMEALSATRRRQADLLSSILPQPFAQLGSPVSGEAHLGEENAAGRVSVYCRKCGVERDGATPGVLFDVRRTRCALCRVPLARGVS